MYRYFVGATPPRILIPSSIPLKITEKPSLEKVSLRSLFLLSISWLFSSEFCFN